jgi:hypothetical protein
VKGDTLDYRRGGCRRRSGLQGHGRIRDGWRRRHGIPLPLTRRGRSQRDANLLPICRDDMVRRLPQRHEQTHDLLVWKDQRFNTTHHTLRQCLRLQVGSQRGICKVDHQARWLLETEGGVVHLAARRHGDLRLAGPYDRCNIRDRHGLRCWKNRIGRNGFGRRGRCSRRAANQ